MFFMFLYVYVFYFMWYYNFSSYGCFMILTSIFTVSNYGLLLLVMYDWSYKNYFVLNFFYVLGFVFFLLLMVSCVML